MLDTRDAYIWHPFEFFLSNFCRRISRAEYVVVFTPRKSHLLSGPNDSLVQRVLLQIPAFLYSLSPLLGFLNCSTLISETTGELFPEFQLLR